MRLVDLEPEWILTKPGESGCWTLAEPRDDLRIIGVKFQCPCARCGGQQGALAILFANPPDGGPPHPNDEDVVGNNRGKRWTLAGGSVLADLSITPSIDATKDEDGNPLPVDQQCWHGFITNGGVS